MSSATTNVNQPDFSSDDILVSFNHMQFDRALNYFNPNLSITTNKEKASLLDLPRVKKLPHLEAYLNMPKIPAAQREQLSDKLRKAEADLRPRVGKSAPGKDWHPTKRTRAPNQKSTMYSLPGRPVFHIVGTEKPNHTKAQIRHKEQVDKLLLVQQERIREQNSPKKPTTKHSRPLTAADIKPIPLSQIQKEIKESDVNEVLGQLNMLDQMKMLHNIKNRMDYDMQHKQS